MSVDDEIQAVRRGSGLFSLSERGILEVRGGDAERWLNGMVSNDVTRLVPGTERSGCRALLLTHRGRIVADLQVLRVADGFWLDLDRAHVAPVRERLSKFVIADDVLLTDRSDDLARLGLEGPQSAAVFGAAFDAPLTLAQDACEERRHGDLGFVAARFGFSGEDAVQFVVARSEVASLHARLAAAVPAPVIASPESLEVLRIEAGRPLLGRELSEEILPPEARLESAVSYTKGCYTGQEIVARLRSRGHVNHLLVGLRLAGAHPPAPGTRIHAQGREIGELTSATRSPHVGVIALGFVRVGFDEPGTEVSVGDDVAHVAALPFVHGQEPCP